MRKGAVARASEGVERGRGAEARHSLARGPRELRRCRQVRRRLDEPREGARRGQRAQGLRRPVGERRQGERSSAGRRCVGSRGAAGKSGQPAPPSEEAASHSLDRYHDGDGSGGSGSSSTSSRRRGCHDGDASKSSAARGLPCKSSWDGGNSSSSNSSSDWRLWEGGLHNRRCCCRWCFCCHCS